MNSHVYIHKTRDRSPSLMTEHLEIYPFKDAWIYSRVLDSWISHLICISGCI